MKIHVAILFKITNIKRKVHLKRGHGGPEGEQKYSSTLSLTSALNGGG
jgi:hypothetical protein